MSTESLSTTKSSSPLRAALDLLFPVQCAGCGLWDTALCVSCGLLSTRTVVSTSLNDPVGAPDIQLLTLGPYEGALRNIILTAKHDAYQDLSPFLIGAGHNLGRGAADALIEGRGLIRDLSIWVVPAPSSPARRRRRAEIVPFIAEGVAAGLSKTLAAQTAVVPAVDMRWWARGQAGKSAVDRGKSRHGALYLRTRPPPGVAAIVVDDVVTTGATMRAVMDHLGAHSVLGVALSAA